MSVTRYKVGDIVKVKEDLKTNQIYGEYYVASDMLKFSGRTVTIKSVEHDSYRIEETHFYWTDEMFEEYIRAEEIDRDSRINNDAISVDLSTKDLLDLYK